MTRSGGRNAMPLRVFIFLALGEEKHSFPIGILNPSALCPHMRVILPFLLVFSIAGNAFRMYTANRSCRRQQVKALFFIRSAALSAGKRRNNP